MPYPNVGLIFEFSLINGFELNFDLVLNRSVILETKRAAKIIWEEDIKGNRKIALMDMVIKLVKAKLVVHKFFFTYSIDSLSSS